MKKITMLLFMCSFSLHIYSQTQSAVTRPTKSRELQIKKGQKYLNLPVNSADPSISMRIKSGKKSLDLFTINLAEDKPEYWTFFDVSDYQGKTITLEIQPAAGGRGGAPMAAPASSNLPSDLSTKGLNQVFADATFPGQDSVYKERDRPQAHFSAQRGWINDPNGLTFYNGEYHMYFQHNPYGWPWGNMHWGHAVSKDLIHWEQLKEAIYPYLDSDLGRNDAAFSGSATHDPKNTAGFRKNGIDPLIVFYTSTGRGECIKLSYDNGRTFEEYAGNPVIKHNGRDPKIMWYAPGNHWVLVVWDAGVPQKIGLGQEVSLRQHSIYTSTDMKNWTYQSGVSGFFECPELFELPVQGEQGVSKWVMYDAYGRYVVGAFDGKTFSVEQPFREYGLGGGYFYASQTFDNTPDKKRIQVGWGRNITHPGMPFNQAMLFPTELKLVKTYEGYRLCPTPISSISTLHKNSQSVTNKVVTATEGVSLSANPDSPIHVIAEFEEGDSPLSLNIMGYELKYDNEWEFSTVPPATSTDASAAPAGPFAAPTTAQPVKYVKHNTNKFKIEAILDKNILEFYINDGELYYVTEFKGPKSGKVEALVKGNNRPGQAATANLRKFIVNKLEIHELASIWK